MRPTANVRNALSADLTTLALSAVALPLLPKEAAAVKVEAGCVFRGHDFLPGLRGHAAGLLLLEWLW